MIASRGGVTLAELITLDHFGAAGRHYHVYRIRSSALDHTEHYHDYFQVCCVTCGEIFHRQEGEQVSLAAGDAFIIPPGFTHSLHFDGTYSEMYSLAFEDAIFRRSFSQFNASGFLDRLRGEPPGGSVRLRLTPDVDQRRSLEALMDCLMRQQNASCSPELSAAPTLIASILCLLAQIYYRQQDAPHSGELVSYNSAMLECTRYIDLHYRDSLRVSDLARRFGLSRSALCAVFPRFTGLSLRRYVAQRRILQAQLLIRARPELPLGQIAQEVGYEDASTFYRNFLRLTGVSPAKYRSMCHGQRIY